MGQIGVEPIKGRKEQEQLKQQQKHYDSQPAEYHMGKPLLALLQQGKAQAFLFRHVHGFFLCVHFYSALSFFTYSRSCSKLPWG